MLDEMAIPDKSTVSSEDAGSQQKTQPTKDTGFRAWSQIAAAFCLYFNTWGKYSSPMCEREALTLAGRSALQLWDLPVIL